MFGLKLDRDVVLASQLLHDLHKPWVFQWQADGTCRKEEPLAATGEHHVLSIAESLRRGLSPELCVAQACAHDHPGAAASEQLVVGWLKAAAVINGKDPFKAGLVEKNGKTLPMPRRMEASSPTSPTMTGCSAYPPPSGPWTPSSRSPSAPMASRKPT